MSTAFEEIENETGEELSGEIDLGQQDTEGIEVEIVSDVPEKDQGKVRDERISSAPVDDDAMDAELRKIGDDAQKQINKLKYEWNEERRAKETAQRAQQEATRFAQSVSQTNHQLQQLLHEGEGVMIQSEQEQSKKDTEKARGEFRVAYDEGDAEKLLKAQEDLNTAQFRSEISRRQQRRVPAPSEQPPPVPQAPSEVDPKLKKWMNANRWFGEDEEMTSTAYGVHQNMITREGFDPNSNKYYNELSKRIRNRYPEKFSGGKGNGKGTSGPTASSRPATVVAPATRTSGARLKVQITDTAVALAKSLGLTNEQYAKQVLKDNENNG